MNERAPGPILRAGVTGGIASGKTTVASHLEELGAVRIDADFIAHEMMEPDGPAYGPVVERFGREILGGDGKIRRDALAAAVFSDPAAREALNALTHPRIVEEIEWRFRLSAAAGGSRLAVVDAALLVESGYHRSLHKLIVVRCSRETQLRRLVERLGLRPEEARARIDSQAPLEAKLALADYVIDTETTLDETRRQTEKVHASLLEDFRRIFPC
jgi:dephospho-CoA kinase